MKIIYDRFVAIQGTHTPATHVCMYVCSCSPVLSCLVVLSVCLFNFLEYLPVMLRVYLPALRASHSTFSDCICRRKCVTMTIYPIVHLLICPPTPAALRASQRAPRPSIAQACACATVLSVLAADVCRLHIRTFPSWSDLCGR